MRTLEGTGRVTPIKMSGLDSKIEALKNTKDVFHVKYPGSGNVEYKYEVKKSKVAILIASKFGSYETVYKYEFNISNGYSYTSGTKNYYIIKRENNVVTLSVLKPTANSFSVEAIISQYD